LLLKCHLMQNGNVPPCVAEFFKLKMFGSNVESDVPSQSIGQLSKGLTTKLGLYFSCDCLYFSYNFMFFTA